MSQTQFWSGVPIQITATVVTAAGAPYSLAGVSASYGFPGGGPASVIALTETSTGIYQGTITTSAYQSGNLIVRVSGVDSDNTLQAVGQCQIPVLTGAWQ